MAESEENAANAQPSSPKLYYIKEARAKAVPQQLTGSHDLMTTFNLLPLYNRYVKQKLENNEDVPPIEPTYFPFISDLPGKNVIKPGNYIRALLEAPEKSYGPIHPFSSSTMRDSFSLRPGPVPGFDSSVLGTEEDTTARNALKIPVERSAGDLHNPTGNSGYGDSNSVHPSSSPTQYGQIPNQHNHLQHIHSQHGSKSSSPHVDKAERGEGEGGREHKHKKKKKKRKHEHDHEHTHHEGEGDSEHRKKKKRKKEREGHGEYGEHGEIDIV